MIKTNRLIAEVAIFAGIIVVLQIVATYINISGFPITLTLIPIIVGGAVYGPKVGALLGLTFGLIVNIMVVTGQDPSGYTMFSTHPLITLTACMVKGLLCGLISALLYKSIYKKSPKLAIYLSAISCPIINTMVLAIFILLFFDSNIQILITLFISINFVIELLINILIAPKLTNLILHNKKRYE